MTGNKKMSFLDWIPGIAGSVFKEGSYVQGAGREFVERAIEKINWRDVQDGQGLMGRFANLFLEARRKLGPTPRWDHSPWKAQQP